MMIHHILRKDLRLLWPFALSLALVPFALVIVSASLGHFHSDDSALTSLRLLLEVVFYFGSGCLILTIVHQDSLVGVRQDWLVRPIRRRDLLFAKLVFVIAVVQVPLLAACTAEGLTDGFAVGHAFLPALSENLWLLLAFTLPVFAIAALTSSITEAIATAVALFLIDLCWAMLLKGSTGNPLGPTGSTAIAWIPGAGQLLICFAGSVTILGVQYFRRRTRAARLALAIALLAWMLAEVTPWRVAFRIEQRISQFPRAASSVTISFDQARGRYQSPLGAQTPHLHGVAFTAAEADNPVLYLPLRISGLEGPRILRIDRAAAYVALPGSGRRMLLNSPDVSEPFDLYDNTGATGSGGGHYMRIAARPRIFSRAKDVPVTVILELSATVLNLDRVGELATSGANQRLDGIGWCRSRINDNQTGVEVRCLDAGFPNQCMTFSLENPASGQTNPDIHGCRDDYSPWLGRYKPPDTIIRSGANLPFRDPLGLVHYPVDASQIPKSVVVLHSYEPAAHFTRQVEIRGVRLSDWTAQQ